MTLMYRYDDVSYAPMCDEFGESRGSSRLEVELRSFEVLRRTQKGTWIDVHGRERFVLDGARKKYAHPTVELAQESFVARKRRQLGIYEARAARARQAIELVVRGRVSVRAA